MGTAACGWSLKWGQAAATENIKVHSHSSFQMISLWCSLYLLIFADSLWQCSVLFSHIFWENWKSLFGPGPAVCLWSGHRSDEHCWLDCYVALYIDLDVFALPSGGAQGDETHDAIYCAMHSGMKDAIRPCGQSVLIVHYPCRSSCRWQSFQHYLYRQSRQNCQCLSQASRPHGRSFISLFHTISMNHWGRRFRPRGACEFPLMLRPDAGKRPQFGLCGAKMG